jgi:ferredoxin
MAPDQPIDFGLQSFCESCNKCARECPSGAITAGPKLMYNGYEIWKSDAEKCARYRITNAAGGMCGRCMKTCPWNLEGLLADSLWRQVAMKLPAAAPALARLDGWPVMVLASDPSFLGGSWDAKTSEKVERFVKLADLFRLPIVHLVDNPGFMIGREAEMAGTIRYGVQAMNAIYKASVPLASIVMRRAYGIAGSAMSNADTYQYRYCWPSGDWGSLPIAGGLEVAYKSEIEAATDPAAELEAIRARLAKVTSPFRSAERFNVEDIIDPRDTRPLLCEFAELAWRRLGADQPAR